MVREATIEWSHRLLEPPERRLLDLLAVFAGSFDLAAAEALAGPVALAGIGRLIDRSMVVAVPTSRGTRYRLLEAIWEHGIRRLTEAGGVADGAADTWSTRSRSWRPRTRSAWPPAPTASS